MELSTDRNGVDFEEDGENYSTFELTEDELEVVEPENDTVPLLELEENSAVEDETLLLDPEESEESTELALTEELETLLDGDEETLDLDISKGMDLLFDQFDDCLALEGEPVVEGKLVRYSWDGMFAGTDEHATLGDAETHFDLGIAYKEMGLLDDAIAEFVNASVSPVRKMECISLQAACHREKGDNELAEKLLLDGICLNKGANEDLLGLKYELALLYESSGRQQEALALYLEINGINPEFHEVEEKILSLRGGTLEMVDLELEELEELEELQESGSQ